MKTPNNRLNNNKKKIDSNKNKITNVFLQKPSINYIKISNNYYKNTIVNVCKIYTNINRKKILIGFSLSNCYGVKSYIKNKINHATQFLYPNYIKNFKHKEFFIPKNIDISFIKHTNAFNPVTLVSNYPFVQNENLKESMQKTLTKFTEHINGRHDPSNEGKVFLINYLTDYILDTPQKEKLFLYICKSSKLQDHLKLKIN